MFGSSLKLQSWLASIIVEVELVLKFLEIWIELMPFASNFDWQDMVILVRQNRHSKLINQEIQHFNVLVKTRCSWFVANFFFFVLLKMLAFSYITKTEIKTLWLLYVVLCSNYVCPFILSWSGIKSTILCVYYSIMWSLNYHIYHGVDFFNLFNSRWESMFYLMY